MSSTAGAVFISYASADVEAASRIAEALGQAGIEVWFDKSELRSGEAWDRKISEQILSCRLFLPVISAQSDARSEGYFRREWRLAVERTRDMSERVAFLVPVVIDGTHETHADVPAAFRSVQWTHLADGHATPTFVAQVARLLGGGPVDPPKAAPAAPSPAAPLPSPRKGPARGLWIAGVLALLAAAAGAGFLLHRGSAASHPATPAAAKAIAVLPFADLSETHDQQYFGDGLAEEILDELARIPGLRVISRTSSFKLRDQADDIRGIAAKLGAAYVAEGSVRRAGDRLRVTVQLIRAEDGTHLWSQTYDRTLSDSLSLQNEIASNVARIFNISVNQSGAGPGGGDANTTSAEALDYYLRGIQLHVRRDREGIDECITYLRKALETDPHFQQAAEELLTAEILRDEFGYNGPSGRDRTRQMAAEFRQRFPQSGQVHLALARIAGDDDWDWAGARREIDLASKLPTAPASLQFEDATLSSNIGN